MLTRFGELAFIETPGGNASAAVATASKGAQGVSVIRQRQQPDGFNPLHTHDVEEVMVLLSGELEVTVKEERVLLHAGDSLIVPAGTGHQLANRGEVPAEWLIIAPAGVKFSHASGEQGVPPWSL
jgi:mannose-6-phosphate isomerase-like protein (cupin superfamily)